MEIMFTLSPVIYSYYQVILLYSCKDYISSRYKIQWILILWKQHTYRKWKTCLICCACLQNQYQSDNIIIYKLQISWPFDSFLQFFWFLSAVLNTPCAIINCKSFWLCLTSHYFKWHFYVITTYDSAKLDQLFKAHHCISILCLYLNTWVLYLN